MPDLKQVEGLKASVLPHSNIEVIEVDNPLCYAVISLQGAQVLKFQKKENTVPQDLLWLSDLNQYQSGKAIRGGIPLCFPWFGGHKTQKNNPSHGFARCLPWQISDVSYAEHTGHELIFKLEDTTYTRSIWNHSFLLQMKISCKDQLTLHFEVVNTGDTDFEYEFAWHSYFPADIHSAKVKGLFDHQYIDQLQDMKICLQTEQDIEFTSEVDRIYPKTHGKFEIQSDQQGPVCLKSNASSAVVWNPWVAKAQRLVDVADAWQNFLCVESGQIKSASVKLAPSRSAYYELVISN